MSASEYLVLYGVTLADENRPTGKTIHRRDCDELPPPQRLLIVRYPDVDGVYLLYMDEHGSEQADTFHDDVQGAIEQAQWEFGVSRSQWESADK